MTTRDGKSVSSAAKATLPLGSSQRHAFRESERRFRDLLEGVQFVAIITDLYGIITFCNAHTLTITGWSEDEIVGRRAGEISISHSRFRGPRTLPTQCRRMERSHSLKAAFFQRTGLADGSNGASRNCATQQVRRPVSPV